MVETAVQPSQSISGIKSTDCLRSGANSSPSPTTETRILLYSVQAGTLEALRLCPDGSPLYTFFFSLSFVLRKQIALRDNFLK